MKGLIIKDFRLITLLKSSLAIFFGLGIFFMITNSVAFGLVYTVFLMSVMAASTMNYDQNENGLAFIMTLPVTKKQYVLEKYVFSFGLTIITDIVMTILGIIITYVKNGSWQLEESLIAAGVALVLTMGITAFTIPIDLKFEREKARMIGIVAALVLGGGVLLAVKLISSIPELVVKITGFMNNPEEISLTILIVGGIIVLAAMVFISISASIKILNNKEL